MSGGFQTIFFFFFYTFPFLKATETLDIVFCDVTPLTSASIIICKYCLCIYIFYNYFIDFAIFVT